MNRSRATGSDFRIRLVYLLPLFAGALLLIPAFAPHIFFYRSGSLSATVNPVDMLGYLRAEADRVLHATEPVAQSSYRFAMLASALTVAAWFFMIWYALFAVATAVLSVWAFGAAPSEALNLAKRVYRVFVPNRVFYGIFCFLPLPVAFMPYFYARFLGTLSETAVSVHFYGAPDFAYALLAGVACALPFYLLLPAQKEKRMDLFRIYKI